MSQQLENLILKVYNKYMLTEQVNRLESDLHTIRSASLRIAFLGPVKAGKSTLINALIGKDLLPVQEDPTTGCITEIGSGKSDCFRVILDSETSEIRDVSKEDAGKYILGRLPAHKVEVEVTSLGLLDDDVSIVDTPGIKSTIKSHDMITQEYLPEVDHAFFTMSGEYGAPQASVLEFIRDDVGSADLDKLIFIVTKSDRHTPEDETKILVQFRKDISSVLENPRIFSVSGQLALEDASLPIEDRRGNLSTIVRLISEEMQPRKKQALQLKVDKLLKERAKQLVNTLEVMREEAGVDTDDLEAESASLKEEIDRLEALKNRLTSKFRNIKNKGYEDADSTAHELTNTMVADYKVNGYFSEEKLLDIVETFQDRLKHAVIRSLHEIDGVEVLAACPGFQDILGNLSDLNNIIGLIDKAASFALTAWLAPGATAGSLELGEGAAAAFTTIVQELKGNTKSTNSENIGKNRSEGNKSSKKKSSVATALKSVGKIVAQVNPVHQVAERLVKPLVFKEVSYTKFRRKLHIYSGEYFTLVESAVKAFLDEEVLTPSRNKETALRSLLATRKDSMNEYQELVTDLTNDIRRLLRGTE